jgi:hypothetical protein
MSEPRDDEQTDLRAALEGAFAADEGAQAAAPADAAPEPVEAPTEGQPRAADGKFAPKTETPGVTAEQSIPTTPATPAPEAETQPIRPPASWSAQAKADFATLAPHIQQEVLKRETDVTKGFEERAAKLKQYEPLDAIIDPIRGRLAANNLTPDAYFRGLANADERLRGPNRLQAFLELGQMYGVDLRQFGQPGQAQQQPQQAQLPPEYQSLAQQVVRNPGDGFAQSERDRHHHCSAIEAASWRDNFTNNNMLLNRMKKRARSSPSPAVAASCRNWPTPRTAPTSATPAIRS